MDQTPKADWKIILAILLCGLVFAWSQNQNYRRTQIANAAHAKQQAAVAASNAAIALTHPMVTSTGGTAISAAVPTPVVTQKKPAEVVTLSNKVLDLKISSDGARPVRADLKAYKSTIDSTQDQGLVQLVATSNNGITPLQAWFGDLTSSRVPTDAPFEKVSESANRATFRYTAADGFTFTRTYATAEDEYLVDVTEEYQNNGSAPITGRPGLVWAANLRGVSSYRSPTGEFEVAANVRDRTQRGVPKKAGEHNYLISPVGDKNEEWLYGGKVEWVGVGDRYFIAAAIPIEPAFNSENDIRLFRESANSIAAVGVGPEMKLDPGTSKIFKYQLYLGPKDYSVLQKAGHNLGETIYWGYTLLEPISKVFWYFLRFLHTYVGNWGWSIIVLTLIVRGALSPLAAKQMKSAQDFAGKSAKLKPQLDKLKEKYKDDPGELNKQTMAMYSQHGLSPLAPLVGCLPMLAQLPVWWALYKVLWGSIDLRQAPFGFWIHDLAAPDPYKVLPVLLGAVTFVQTKLTPQAPGQDAAQQKMMLYTMPVLFTAMMLSLPAGLVLYIFTSTLMNIGQQYYLRQKYPVNRPPTAPVATGAPKEAT